MAELKGNRKQIDASHRRQHACYDATENCLRVLFQQFHLPVERNRKADRRRGQKELDIFRAVLIVLIINVKAEKHCDHQNCCNQQGIRH